jgi:hypothetical protein
MRSLRGVVVFRRFLVVLVGALALAVPLAAADDGPSYQHVWVHYDYMAGYDTTDGKYVSFKPDPAAIQMVVDAFRQHGVILHIDPQHDALPWHEVIIPDFIPLPASFFSPACTGSDAVRYSALRAQYFQPPDSHPWHYMVFADSVFTPEDGGEAASCGDVPGSALPPVAGSSGFSALPGFDFVVTLGTWSDHASDPPGCWIDYATLTSLRCWPVPDYAVASTFMHELGHNLGLRHGGDTDMNYKPNYVSVMNYAYQLSAIITTSAATPSGYSFRVDYSDETLPALNESNLSEPAGIGSVLHPNDLVFWWCFSCNPGGGLLGPASGPIDWNQDGNTTDTGLQIDIDGDTGYIENISLTGFDDWAYIHRELLRPPEQGSDGEP